MARTKRRKAAALALVAVGVAGLSIASAAQLNIGSASLGAGTTVVASCQPTGDDLPAIQVGFDNEFVTGQYYATKVTLDKVASACRGLDVKVTLTDSDGDPLQEITGVIGDINPGTTGSWSTEEGSLSVPAADIEGVAVVIYS